MKHTKMTIITGSAFYAALLCLLPSAGEAQCTASIGSTNFPSVQEAVNASSTNGATINVSGTCSGFVTISEHKHRLTLDGGGTATISGPNTTDSTIVVRGRGTVIRNFASITGGDNGILVTRGGTADVRNNTIQDTGQDGILVNRHSSVQINNNTIQNNPRHGILINETSYARIGFVSPDDTTASPNTIQMNGGNGILVTRSSNARIVGNTISDNTGDGIVVARGSHADVSSNTINGNGGDGILVSQNSGANLGENTGTSIFELANSTNVNNGGFGIRCRISSYANGRLGTLNGTTGPASFQAGFGPEGGCIDSLIP